MEEDEFLGDDDSDQKSPSAQDYYDINELCEDFEDTVAAGTVSSDSDSDARSDSSVANHCAPPDFVGDLHIPGKPLASVLPRKYLNVEIKSLFPDFCENSVLRFHRLFGPGKPSNMPDIWRSVRKKAEIEKSLKESESSGAFPKDDLEVEPDEEIKFLLDRSRPPVPSDPDDTDTRKRLTNTWRFGAAQLWYDMVSLPEDAETYDYGFKLKEPVKNDTDPQCENGIPCDAFLMLNQNSWEDDVIWDGDDVKEEVMKTLYSKKAAGWLPVGSERTAESFNEHVNFVSSQANLLFRHQNYAKNFDKKQVNSVDETQVFLSMFPEENDKLLNDRWEDDVIWDSDAMERISYPKAVEINDKDIIVKIPDEELVSEEPSEVSKDRKDRKYRPLLKQNEEDEDSDLTSTKLDFYNISNDEYYNAKLTQDAALKLSSGGSLLQHSIPAIELHPAYFPTHIASHKLRYFHRPPLKMYSHGALSQVDFHGVHSLAKHIKHKQKQRLKELEESGGGEMFFMRTPEDLSAKDGELVCFEYSEEHPPLMMQIGMASKIRNYYRRRPDKETVTTDYKYGETAYAHTSPFLGALQPGQSLQAYENNLFRSPIYEHPFRDTDFLIIRTRHKYYIRDIETVYTVGQQLPLMEVPTPKSEKASNFLKDFLMIFIYRLFMKSPDDPRKIKMEDIRNAFPDLREFSIRKRLNTCAEFQRTGSDSKSWVLKNNFRLPTKEEIREMISPEQCCAYYSMIAAEQRLKEAGYGEQKFQIMAEEENDESQLKKIDDEVKAAPWHTTQAFISAVKGKCLLELFGVADPTGCGEGFAYVRVPSRPQWLKDECSLQNPAKRLVRGTDADLRRLSLPNAKKLLRTFNVPDQEIKRMTRWQVIDVVRTLSTEQAKLGEEGITKFARGNIYSHAEHQRKYKEECQRLFDLQNKVLASEEVLSTDEESSSEEDSDLEEMGKHIENILSNKKTVKDVTHEAEEAQRKELQKMMTSDSPPEDAQKNKIEKPETSIEGKILKIYRTFQNVDGSKYVRVQTVRKPEVIGLYTRIRETKDENFIRDFSLDESEKEKMRREKRRLQDQLRRIKRNELKEKTEVKEPVKKKVKIDPSLFKVKCGACGAAGHMRTNKACPLYQSSPSLPPIQVAMTEEQEEAEEKACLADQNLIKLDETKIILSKTLLKHSNEVRRKSLVLKIPKEAVLAGRKKRSYDVTSGDYLSAPKYVNRKRIDPVVSINIIFENLLSELKSLPDTQPFWFPVSSKIAPDYHLKIKNPMDLHTMRDRAGKQQYKSREDFLTDLTQMLENCKIYNGAHSYLSITAQTMVDYCIKCFSEKEEKLMHLEKSINPLLDDDQVAFSFMLETIVNDHLKTVSDSWIFHNPVDKRVTKGYYDLVKTPMDLGSVARNCKANKYKTRLEFAADVELIYKNSLRFNGANSQYTKTAMQIVDACRVSLEMYEEQLKKYELGIKTLGNNDSPAPEQSLSPSRTKERKRYSRMTFNDAAHDTVSNSSKATHFDSFVDVESFDASPENSIQDPFVERSDYNMDLSDTDKAHEPSSAYAYSPIVDYNNHESHNSASPTNSTKSQSLFPVNGIHNIDIVNTSPPENIQPFTQSTCDNICDDLMLSESDSDDAVEVEGELKF